MYNYEIGYYSPEESEYIQLTHEKKFTTRQLQNKVQAIMKDALVRYVESRLDGVVSRDWSANAHIGFDDLNRIIVDLLCEKFGFAKLKFQASFAMFGWDDMVEGDGFNGVEKKPDHAAMIKCVQEAYHELNLWHDPKDYNYYWDKIFIYKEEENPLELIKEQSMEYNVTVEYAYKPERAIKSSSLKAILLIRVPREQAPNLPSIHGSRKNQEEAEESDLGRGCYFNGFKRDREYSLYPLWYSDEELYKMYKVRDKDWKILK